MKNHAFHPIGTMVVLAFAAIQSLAQSTYEPYTFTTLAGGRQVQRSRGARSRRAALQSCGRGGGQCRR